MKKTRDGSTETRRQPCWGRVAAAALVGVIGGMTTAAITLANLNWPTEFVVAIVVTVAWFGLAIKLFERSPSGRRAKPTPRPRGRIRVVDIVASATIAIVILLAVVLVLLSDCEPVIKAATLPAASTLIAKLIDVMRKPKKA